MNSMGVHASKRTYNNEINTHINQVLESHYYVWVRKMRG